MDFYNWFWNFLAKFEICEENLEFFKYLFFFTWVVTPSTPKNLSKNSPLNIHSIFHPLFPIKFSLFKLPLDFSNLHYDVTEKSELSVKLWEREREKSEMLAAGYHRKSREPTGSFHCSLSPTHTHTHTRFFTKTGSFFSILSIYFFSSFSFWYRFFSLLLLMLLLDFFSFFGGF